MVCAGRDGFIPGEKGGWKRKDRGGIDLFNIEDYSRLGGFSVERMDAHS